MTNILKYFFATIISLVLVGFSVGLLKGGLPKVYAWNYLRVIPPAAGLLVLIAAIVTAFVSKRFDGFFFITAVLSLTAMLPALLLLFPRAYPASIERMQPTATVRLPSDAPLLVAWGGDSLKENYHVVTADQRWAYYFVVTPYFHGSSELEDYGCYGVPVVAPADGEVVIAHDGERDEIPGVISKNYEAPGGNEVAICLESGTYLLIAHLKQGSVAVKVGDMVKEGQLIGFCGNSGITSEPHIHIHHQRQNPVTHKINFAEGLPLFFRDHDGPQMPTGGYRLEGDIPVPLGLTLQHNEK